MHFLFLQILPQSTVMASYLIALALVAVCLPFAAPQEAAPVGSCSRLEVSNFFTLIPNPAVCGPAVDRFYNGTNVTDAEFQAGCERYLHCRLRWSVCAIHLRSLRRLLCWSLAAYILPANQRPRDGTRSLSLLCTR